jgi:hypothetical protein
MPDPDLGVAEFRWKALTLSAGCRSSAAQGSKVGIRFYGAFTEVPLAERPVDDPSGGDRPLLPLPERFVI